MLQLSYIMFCQDLSIFGTVALQKLGIWGKDDFSITVPHQVHELQTNTQPCLMAYIWTDDLTPQNWWWEQLVDGSWERLCWARTPAGDWSMLRREPLSDAEIARAGDG